MDKRKKLEEDIRATAYALTNLIVTLKEEFRIDMTEEIHQYMEQKLNPEGKDERYEKKMVAVDDLIKQLEAIYTNCCDKRVWQIQNKIGDLLRKLKPTLKEGK